MRALWLALALASGCRDALGLDADAGICELEPFADPETAICRAAAPSCGCGEGLACRVALDGARSCETPGSLGEREPCTEDADCIAGTTCWRWSDDVLGRCLPFCETPA